MPVTSKNINCLILSAFAFVALSAAAADVPPRGPVPFEAFDKDGDEMISPQEYVEIHNQRRKKQAGANMPPGRMRADTAFTYFDTNYDNLISAEELDAGRVKMRQQRFGMQRGMPPRSMQHEMPAGMGPGMNRGRQMPGFAEFDLDGDGAMTSEEFYEARDRRMRQRAEQGYAMRNASKAPPFESIDTDGDGKVTEEEFSAHLAMYRQMRGAR